MRHWLLVSSLWFAGCAPSREVSRIKYTRTNCDTGDCSVQPGGREFIPADDSRPVVRPEDQNQDPGKVASAKAPEPTCRLIGEMLASLEVGDYADPEERAPKVAAGEQRCLAAKPSLEDRKCFVDSWDQTSMAYCIPALFPAAQQPPAVSARDCDAMGNVIRTQLQAQQAQAWEKNLSIVIASCKADRWNAAMLQCAQQSSMVLYPQNCGWIQPAAIYRKFNDRYQASLKK